jgi:hypothetical protein
MIGPPGASRSRGPVRPSSATIGAALVRRSGAMTAAALVRPSGATTAAIRPGPCAMTPTVAVRSAEALRARAGAEPRFAGTTGPISPEDATPAHSPRVRARAPAHAAPAAIATKARPGTRAKSRAVAARLRRAAAVVVHRHARAVDRRTVLARPVVRVPERSVEVMAAGRAVQEGQPRAQADRVARETAASGRPAGRRTVVVVQAARLEGVAAPALPRATRRDGLVAGRDL